MLSGYITIYVLCNGINCYCVQLFCELSENYIFILFQGHVNSCTIWSTKNCLSGFGGLEVACWPLVPKFAGSNSAEAVGFLRVNKNPQHVGGHGCLSVVIVVCCQVEVSATN